MNTKILISLIVITCFQFIEKGLAQQCLSGGCTSFGSQYPSSGAPYTPPSSWQVLINPATGNAALMNGSNWTRFNVVSGNTYEWTYCEVYGGLSSSWDAQLTLFNNTNLTTKICFSTDVCGTNNNAPYISWTATFTGVVRLLTTAYVSGVGGCQSNSGATNKLAYRQIVCTPPSTPTGLNATAVSSSQINLNWNSVSGATGYDIHYCDGTFIAYTTSTNYAHTGRVANTTYSYKIFAQKNSSCISSYTNCVNATTPSSGCITPGTPASATGVSTGQTSANLSWSANSTIGSPTVTYYWVVGTSSSVTYGSGIDQGTTTGTAVSTSALTCGTTYFLRVYAKTSCNNTSSGYKTSSSFTTSSCSTATILGVDISHWNGTVSMSTIYSAGKSFSYVKATEGVNTNDDTFTYNMTSSNPNGVVLGSYHLCRPDISINNTAVNEANHFISIAGDYIGNGFLPPALDMEKNFANNYINAGHTYNELAQWINNWCTIVYNSKGKWPILYTSKCTAAPLYSYFQNGTINMNVKLWIADYNNSAGNPSNSTGCNWVGWPWVFHQYYAPTTAGNNPTTYANPGMDQNIFNGSLASFNNLIGGTINIEDINENSYLIIFPNPTNGILTVEIDNLIETKIEIEIINILGEKIYAQSFNNHSSTFQNQIDINDFSNGIYFVQLINGDKKYVGKIIKQ